ncbi:MAG: S41 family peptidase [Chitinophagaceae bacterium]
MLSNIRIILFISFCFFLLSCKKNISSADSSSGSQPANFPAIFESFWTAMNINYVYWDVDTTDWDEVYKKYKPVFETLDIQNPSHVKRSVQYFREMTADLSDGHAYINFQNSILRDSIIYTSLDQRKQSKDYHNSYPYFSVVRNYLDSTYFTGNNIIAGYPSLFVASGTINSKTLYFSCSNFFLARSYNATNGNSAKNVIQYFFDQLKAVPAGVKGIIIDVRGNSGGDLSDLNFFGGHFVEQPLHFGYTRYKSGNGRLDYTPWLPSYINPVNGNRKIDIPVVILTDHFSASLSETFTCEITQLPKGISVGEKTWGATGPITLNEVYNDGQFKVGDFMNVQISSAMFKTVDQKIYEGKGMPPMIAVAFNKSMLDAGRDLQLEKAISLIQ